MKMLVPDSYITANLLEAILRGITLIICNQYEDKSIANQFKKYAESTIKLSKALTERN